MNERIKQLLDEATVYALHETKDAVDFLDNPVSKQQRERQLELFAELIVQGCADFVRENYDHEAAESIAWCMEINYGLHGDYA